MSEGNEHEGLDEEVPVTSSIQKDAARLLDGLVQLRFSDEAGTLHDLSAAEVADALQGLVAFTSQMASAGLFGEGFPPQVRVRPPREGSFTLEALLHFAHDDGEVAAAMYTTGAAAVALALRTAARRLRGTTPSNFEHLDNGNVKVSWSDGTVNEMPAKVWKELNAQKKATKRSLSKLMAPLGDDVVTLEIRSAELDRNTEEVLATEAEVILDRSDYRTAVAVEPDPEDEVEVFEVEARMLNVDFRRGQKWRIETRQGSTRRERTARMEDDAFQQALDDGRALRKSDILRLKISEVLSVTNGRTSRDWTIVQVVSQRRGSGDDDGPAPSAEPSD